VNGSQEVAGSLVVASRDGAILLDACKEVFDQMPGLVQMPVVRTLRFTVRLGRDDDLLLRSQQGFNDPFIGIKRLIRNHRLRRGIGQQHVGTFQVTGLTRRQVKPSGIAQRIDGGMDFGAQTTTAAPDRLVFFLAPALC